MNLHPRHVLRVGEAALADTPAVMNGVRQAGKTTLVQSIAAAKVGR